MIVNAVLKKFFFSVIFIFLTTVLSVALADDQENSPRGQRKDYEQIQFLLIKNSVKNSKNVDVLNAPIEYPARTNGHLFGLENSQEASSKQI